MTSRKQIEESTPYSENFYHHIEDYRTQKEKIQQHDFVESVLKTNINHFQITMTEKTKVKYEPKPRIKVQLEDGWYCYITDNQLNRPFTILTVHGAPGDHIQWAGLQTEMNQTCRWINLTIPGFDQEDERRGTYNGTSPEFAQMIVKLITKLGLKKIVYCGHSLGSIFASYFITNFPQYIQGYINVTGIVNIWYTGLLSFFWKSIGQWNLNNPKSRNEMLHFSNQQRINHHKNFLQATSQYFFGPVKFPQLTLTEYYAYIKLFDTYPNGLSQMYKLNMRLPFLRVLFFGKKDPLHNNHYTQQSMFFYCKNQQSYTNSPQFKNILKLAKQQLQKTIKQKFNIKQFNSDYIQSYFCYHFEDTGHNAHKRRPKEMSKVIKIYICCLQVLNKYKTAKLSKL